MQDVRPGGALEWFVTLSSAISSLASQEQALIAWDKVCTPSSSQKVKKGSKVFAVFASHAILWQELEKLPQNERYAYEVVQQKQHCKAYWDIEFTKCVPASERDNAKQCVYALVREWIMCLKREFRKAFRSAREDARVAVLEGTRELDSGSDVKYSFHVIIVNYAFSSNKSTAFQRLRQSMPSLYNIGSSLGTDSRFIPSSSDTCAPDLCVWKDNQLFRSLSCSKRGASTPLSYCDELTETKNPMDSFLTYFGSLASSVDDLFAEDAATGVVQSDVDRPKHKKQRTGQAQHTHALQNNSGESDQDHGAQVERLLHKYPLQMRAIHEQVQLLLQSWGDQNTYVEKLVRASTNLRYQCRNVVNRPCLFTTENHQSNTPIVWLDAPITTNAGNLSETYTVTYICKSAECNCSGIIGQIFSCSASGAYTFERVYPAIMNSSPVLSRIRQTPVPIISLDATPSSLDAPSSSLDAPSSSLDAAASLCPLASPGALHVTQNNGSGVEKEAATLNAETGDEALGMMEADVGTCLTHKKNLVQERIHGWGWTEEEIRVYGIENSYSEVKKRFESRTCKIESPSVIYLRFNNPERNLMDYNHYTHEGMQHLEKSNFYYKKDTQYDPPIPARFFASWTDDSMARKYNKIVFDPSSSPTTDLSSPTSGENLNLWPGIKASRIEACCSDPGVVDDLVRPIRDHVLHVLTSGNEEHCDWVLDWMANIVKRPHMKTQVPIVISGKQGVGKGIIFDFFREHVLGSSITSQIQNPAQDLFSRFANSHVNKIFLQIDEGEGLSKFSDHLKNLITADRMHYEIKGMSPTSADNYINIVITTNHERPVLVETSDRRYVLFKASDVHLSDPNYYISLASHLRRPDVARAFYEYLFARDIESRYPDHFQTSRPMTEYYRESRKNSIPIIQRFLSAVSNSRRYTSEVSALTLFKDFIQFTEAGRFQTHMTSCKFGSLLNSVSGVVKTKKTRGVYYNIDCDVLKSHLLRNHEYDEDAVLDT